MFYWITIMFSQTLGTALGDWTADTAGLGYEGAAFVFGAMLSILGVGVLQNHMYLHLAVLDRVHPDPTPGRRPRRPARQAIGPRAGST